MTGDAARDHEATSHHWGGTDQPLEDEYAAHRRAEAQRATCGRRIDFFYGVNTACGRPLLHDGDCHPVPLATDKEAGDA